MKKQELRLLNLTLKNLWQGKQKPDVTYLCGIKCYQLSEENVGIEIKFI